ncbi:MAG: peroxiredoxin family protein [Candidatus Zixiibacteriota bacterium]
MKKHLNTILLIIVVLLSAEIFYLVFQNRKLRAMIDNLPQFTTLNEGDRVPGLKAVDINGQPVDLKYGTNQPHTMMFWFSPTCSYCADNMMFWNQLYNEYVSDAIRIIGVCACDPDEADLLVEEHHLEFPIVCINEPYLINVYHGNVLPQTLLIAPEGNISGIWPGTLANEQIDEIFSALAEINISKMEGGEKE